MNVNMRRAGALRTAWPRDNDVVYNPMVFDVHVPHKVYTPLAADRFKAARNATRGETSMSGSSLTDLARIRQAPLLREPYPHFLCSDLLRQEKIEDLRDSFPEIDKPGYLTVEEVSLKGAFRELIEQLEGEEVTEALSEKFGQDLHPYPRLTTVMRWSQRKYGAIHTDGASKVMTMLVYMNDAWNTGEGGRLRVLYDGKNYEPYAVEVPPVMGTAFAFLRSDNSWHGHLPFTGERKVVQIAWIKDRAELERKKRRNSVAQSFKSIFGR